MDYISKVYWRAETLDCQRACDSTTSNNCDGLVSQAFIIQVRKKTWISGTKVSGHFWTLQEVWRWDARKMVMKWKNILNNFKGISNCSFFSLLYTLLILIHNKNKNLLIRLTHLQQYNINLYQSSKLHQN